MAGHSKWSQIKHKKAKEDAKRGQAFTKLIKEITVCARDGGGDPSGNARLRLLMEKAKQINMPLENTMRAIKRGTGELPGVNYEHITYEGYGPENIAVVIETLTDNKNRTVAELRHLFSAKGGRLAETGAVSWMFDHVGVIRVPASGQSEDGLLELLIEHNLQDIRNEQEVFAILCDAKNMEEVKATLQENNIAIESADLEWIAKSVSNLESAQENKAYDFLSALEEHDDVKNVFTNVS